MKDATLDNILTTLNNHGVNNKFEIDDTAMQQFGLDPNGRFGNSYLIYLKKQDYIDTETIPYYQVGDQFHPARYLCWITPNGSKFITDGGFSGQASYLKKTLRVATQSRNWAIAAVGLTILLFIVQPFYNGCKKSDEKKAEPESKPAQTEMPASIKPDAQIIKKDSTKTAIDTAKS